MIEFGRTQRRKHLSDASSSSIKCRSYKLLTLRRVQGVNMCPFYDNASYPERKSNRHTQVEIRCEREAGASAMTPRIVPKLFLG